MTAPALSCSQASLDAGEPLFASAMAKTDLWLAIEHTDQWSREILDTPTLPPRTRAWIETFMAAFPRARPQLIRQPTRPTPPEGAPKRFFFARSGEGVAALWEFTFERWGELEAIDLAALATAANPMPDKRRAAPLLLVCTHGKRDACCARKGPPIYYALAEDDPDVVWQCSHLGGHRFAATMLCLPHGLSFGRLDVASARRIAQRYRGCQVSDLDRYRGRTTYAQPVQAAEYFVRQATGIYGVDAIRYTRGEIAGHERWLVCFEDDVSGETHELTIARVASGDQANRSCGKGPEPVNRYVLESYRQLPPA